MKLSKKITIIILSVALSGYTQIFAVQPSGVVSSEITNYRFDFVESGSPWLTSLNPAGLADFKYDNIAFGSTTFSKKDGELKNYFESNDSFEFKVGSKSLYRFNDKVVASGAVSYTNFSGQNMSGSVFMNPYDRPFDIVDFDTSTQGVKNIELYTISGAVSAQLFKGFEFGAALDFNSANYAKMKDLRYKTSYSKLSATAALRYSPFKNFYIGGGYTFSQEIEGIAFSFYGAENILYRELVSFGGFWGISSTYSDMSHNFVKNSRQPFIELAHRFSAQLSYKISDFTFMAEGYYKNANGFYGIENPSSVVHTKNNNIEYGANAQLLYSTPENRHSVFFRLQDKTMENFRTVWRDQSTGGGNSEVVYFDPVKAGDNSQNNFRIGYKGDYIIENMTPLWQVSAEFSAYNRKTFATIYPFYRKQEVNVNTLSAKVLRNIKWNKNTVAIALGGGYQWGGGILKQDGTYATPSEEMSAPKTSEDMMQKEWDFLTSKQYRITPMVRYSYLLGAKTEIYAELEYSLANAFELSKKQNSFMLSIGCNF